MLTRMLQTGLFAGFLTALIYSLVQSVTVTPIIYEAEEIHRTMSFCGSAYSEDTNIEKKIDQADQRLDIAKNLAGKKLYGKMRKPNQ